MKRIDGIKSMDEISLAKWLMGLDGKDLGELYCKSDCPDDDEFSCPHPTECMIKWLNEKL